MGEVLIDENEFHDVQMSITPRSRPGSRQKNKEKTQKPEQEVVEKRPGSRESMSGFTQTEPAEWYQQDDNEDELMIILDTENIVLDEEEREVNPLGLLGSRPESRERSSSRNSQGSSSNLQTNENISAAPEGQAIPNSISKNIQVLRKMDMEIELDVQTDEDLEALEQLEKQYEMEHGNGSRNSKQGRISALSNSSKNKADIHDPSSVSDPRDKEHSQKVSTDINENVEGKESRNSRPGRRSSLKSANKRRSFS